MKIISTEREVKSDENEHSGGGGNMRKSIAILALAAFVALGLMYTGAMNLAQGYVHVGKTVKTPRGVYHKGRTFHAY
jgi:hypothetical protein